MLLNRRQWVFADVHPQYTFVLVSWLKSRPQQNATLPLRGPYASWERFAIGTATPSPRYPVSEVLSWTDSASLPLLPTDKSLDVFIQLRKSPRLDIDDGISWKVRPHTELHATNDKPLMKLVDEQPDGYWPVFKGESFDLWQPDTGSYYAWARPDKVRKELLKTRARVSKKSVFMGFTWEWRLNPETLPCNRPRIAFRDVTNRTNTRTVVTCLLPGNVFCTNKAPYLLWLRGDEQDQAFLLGVMSSLPFDWYARRFVELNLNFYILKPFPVPRPNRSDARWERVVQLAGRLACPDKRFAEWARSVGVKHGPMPSDELEDHIRELDAVVAHLYGLSESQLRQVFETFHEGWDYRERLSATLEHFRKWQIRV